MNLGWGKGISMRAVSGLQRPCGFSLAWSQVSLSRFALTGECPNLHAGDGPP
jgi:hypothetical protein